MLNNAAKNALLRHWPSVGRRVYEYIIYLTISEKYIVTKVIKTIQDYFAKQFHIHYSWT